MDASGLPKRKAPKIKPRIEGKVWDDSILLNAGLMILKEPINWFTEDFADYFNQIPLSPAYYWTACFSWWLDDDVLHAHSLKGFLSAQTLLVTYVPEKRLGFGVSLSLNFAQRLSKAVVADFRARFDAKEYILSVRKHFGSGHWGVLSVQLP
jgi:hypothetical protein